MKAILVIDMPSSCLACPLHDRSDYSDGCLAIYRRHSDSRYINNREEWCPLRPMPMEFTVEKLSEEEQDSTKMLVETAIMKVYADGWNDCLKEINETEKTT